MKHLKFEATEISKSQFFVWLTNTLESNGWSNITSHSATEGWYYQSKGEDGESNIIVQFRDGYDGHNNYPFSSTDYRYVDMRMVISYEPNETNGKVGTSVPATANSQFTRLFIGHGAKSLFPDAKLKIHYNCNKNRMIFLVTNSVSTFFCMFGRPDKNYAKEYSDTGNMLFTTHNYRLDRVGSWGIADRPTTAYTPLQVMYVPIENGLVNNKLIFCEIGFGSPLEGFKGRLEGMYYVATKSNNKIVASMTGDKYIDELGNEYTLFYIQNSGSSNYPSALPNDSHIAICTKLAGED